MEKKMIKQWFEINRPDYIFNSRLTDEFINSVYEQIKADLIDCSEEEMLFIIASELQFGYDMALSKELYKKTLDILLKNFEKEYFTLQEQENLRNFVSEISFNLEKQGAILASVIYSENNEIELNEKTLNNLIYNEINNNIQNFLN